MKFLARWRRYFKFQRMMGESRMVAFIHSLDDALWVSRMRRGHKTILDIREGD